MSNNNKITYVPGTAPTSTTMSTMITGVQPQTLTYTVSAEVWDYINKGSVTVPIKAKSVAEQLHEEEDVRAQVIDALRDMGYIVIAPPPVIE